MKRTFSPMLSIGLIIVGTYTIIERFITPISDWLAIPLLVVAIIMIVIGALKTNEKNKIGKKWAFGFIQNKTHNVDYLFSNMYIDRIYIETNETNIPSLKLFGKLNFNKCGEYLEDEDIKFIVMEKIRTSL